MTNQDRQVFRRCQKLLYFFPCRQRPPRAVSGSAAGTGSGLLRTCRRLPTIFGNHAIGSGIHTVLAVYILAVYCFRNSAADIDIDKVIYRLFIYTTRLSPGFPHKPYSRLGVLNFGDYTRWLYGSKSLRDGRPVLIARNRAMSPHSTRVVYLPYSRACVTCVCYHLQDNICWLGSS